MNKPPLILNGLDKGFSNFPAGIPLN